MLVNLTWYPFSPSETPENEGVEFLVTFHIQSSLSHMFCDLVPEGKVRSVELKGIVFIEYVTEELHIT